MSERGTGTAVSESGKVWRDVAVWSREAPVIKKRHRLDPGQTAIPQTPGTMQRVGEVLGMMGRGSDNGGASSNTSGESR